MNGIIKAIVVWAIARHENEIREMIADRGMAALYKIENAKSADEWREALDEFEAVVETMEFVDDAIAEFHMVMGE